jgi:hypothetical protein
MTNAQNLQRIAVLFGNAKPKTTDGKKIRTEFINWFKSLKWYDKSWPNLSHSVAIAATFHASYTASEVAGSLQNTAENWDKFKGEGEFGTEWDTEFERLTR